MANSMLCCTIMYNSEKNALKTSDLRASGVEEAFHAIVWSQSGLLSPTQVLARIELEVKVANEFRQEYFCQHL